MDETQVLGQEERALAMMVKMSGDVLTMVEEMIEGKDGKLKVSKDKDGVHFTCPRGWFKESTDAFHVASGTTGDLVAATWQADMLMAVFEIYGFTDSDLQAVATSRKDGTNPVYTWTAPWEVLKRNQTNVTFKSFEARELRKQMNIAIAGKKTPFGAKEQRLNDYQAAEMLLLLQGKISLPQQTNCLFVQPSEWQKETGMDRNKADYDVVATGYMTRDEITGQASMEVSREAHKVEILDDKGRTIRNKAKAAKAAGLAEEASWDDINEAAVKAGIAKVTYHTVKDVLGNGVFGMIASLSRTDYDDKSRCLNWKTILGHESGRFFANDTKGLDKSMVNQLRTNAFALGTRSVEKEGLLIFEVTGELPSCDYNEDTKKVWESAITPVNWSQGNEKSRHPHWKNWENTTPNPALEYGQNGVDIKWKPINMNGLYYPIFTATEQTN
jgi:hypothetical protein